MAIAAVEVDQKHTVGLLPLPQRIGTRFAVFFVVLGLGFGGWGLGLKVGVGVRTGVYRVWVEV